MAHTGRCKIFPTHSSTNRPSVIGLAAGTFDQCRLCGADGRRLREGSCRGCRVWEVPQWLGSPRKTPKTSAGDGSPIAVKAEA